MLTTLNYTRRMLNTVGEQTTCIITCNIVVYALPNIYRMENRPLKPLGRFPLLAKYSDRVQGMAWEHIEPKCDSKLL